MLILQSPSRAPDQLTINKRNASGTYANVRFLVLNACRKSGGTERKSGKVTVRNHVLRSFPHFAIHLSWFVVSKRPQPFSLPLENSTKLVTRRERNLSFG